MGRVECINIPGLELLFYSGDHGPPHFHAKRKGEWEIRVFFLWSTNVEMKYNVKWPKGSAGPSSRVVRLLHRQVMMNQIQLTGEWKCKVLGVSPND